MPQTDSIQLECSHQNLVCLNGYEIIRKYECATCGAVVMCDCDKAFGARFLPHQLKYGTSAQSRRRIAVTGGFQPRICEQCRGLPPTPYPKAELHGASSKLRRYYWREIYFETTRRFATWAEARALDRNKARRSHPQEYVALERQVIREISEEHQRSPKYTYVSISADEVLQEHSVSIIKLTATYTSGPDGVRHLVSDLGTFDSPEQLAMAHLSKRGFQVIRCESRPLHVLFGLLMWLVVQSPSDPERQFVGFGSRTAHDEGRAAELIYTFLPRDFGTTEYGARTRTAVDEHFELFEGDRSDLFDYWLHDSAALREYLWAHREEDIRRARILFDTLPTDAILRILNYLMGDYWHRYLGWPDLFAWTTTEHLFVEVKGSRDSFREDQLRWIEGNATELHLPFEVLKIGRTPQR